MVVGMRASNRTERGAPCSKKRHGVLAADRFVHFGQLCHDAPASFTRKGSRNVYARIREMERELAGLRARPHC